MCIYDDASAAIIANERIRNLGFVKYTRQFLAAVSFGWLEVGDFVYLTEKTDDDPHAFDQMVEIVGKSFTGTGWIFNVLIETDPAVGV